VASVSWNPNQSETPKAKLTVERGPGGQTITKPVEDVGQGPRQPIQRIAESSTETPSLQGGRWEVDSDGDDRERGRDVVVSFLARRGGVACGVLAPRATLGSELGTAEGEEVTEDMTPRLMGTPPPPPPERVVEGYALQFGKVDRQGEIVTPDALKNLDLKRLQHTLVDLRMNQGEPIGTVKEAEIRDEGLYVRVRIVHGVVLPVNLGDLGIGIKGAIRKSRKEGDVTVVEDLDLHGVSIVPKDELP